MIYIISQLFISQISKTGDLRLSSRLASQQYAVLGWIPIINQTIESPLSKTYFRGDKFYDLFVLWWNTIPQQWLPVVGARKKC
ncbi:hypothetical protein B1F79_03495 [Coxiella-like endosymbiont of Rhipicephalus sanguineus]|uniref:hypothetical protein n=1 Tax=Coxiella-like endosymbiont of Rhipicephalus sanguineus TaxID=1955402 RepID=UPI002041BEC5|nr:hypothetical protein [Coxiella-like endosymbiont of Rhipicephalus sanguineus]MBT8506594.1 hypothetical protein [Coxiella-like endosymbiont of Rhipicephalus sanguineus]